MKIRNQTTLYFIRHAQTLSNVKNIKQGVKINEYLNTQGILDLQKNLIPIIKLLDLDIVFTSYLHRSEETAAFLRQSLREPIGVLHDSRLTERDFGSLSGQQINKIKALIPDFDERERTQTYDYQAFGGESVDQVRRRVLSAVYDIAQNYQNQNIGLITHGGPIRILLFHFPEITRIFHNPGNPLKDIANGDVYEWEINETKLKTLQSLIAS